MEKQRKIIHIDQDCFFAAVEIKDNPSLKGKPVAVGGRAEGRGVLTTASYEARKFGVRSAMPTSRALRICPQLILIPPHFDRYREESRHIRSIFKQFTQKIEPLSLDEAYLDVSDCTMLEGSATRIATDIRKQILAETGLTASAGIAPNKFLAKVASDWKKPNGQFTIAPHQISAFVKMLKVEKIPGVGKVTAGKMHRLGIQTCKDLQEREREELVRNFGSWGAKLHHLAFGEDNREVQSRSIRKSLSVENTYAKDLITLEECLARIPELYEQFHKRLKKSQVEERIKSLFVKLKFSNFRQTTLERSQLKVPSEECFKNMISEAYARSSLPVRLLGLGVKLHSGESQPADLQIEFL